MPKTTEEINTGAIDKALLERNFFLAMEEVLSTMTGLGISETTKEDNRMCEGEEITGTMLIIGQRNAMVCISVSRETAYTLVSYMTGTLPGEISDEELYDGITELVNMVTGRAKALLAGTEYHYQLTSPFTIVGKSHSVIPKSRAVKINKRYMAGDMDISLNLLFL